MALFFISAQTLVRFRFVEDVFAIKLCGVYICLYWAVFYFYSCRFGAFSEKHGGGGQSVMVGHKAFVYLGSLKVFCLVWMK